MSCSNPYKLYPQDIKTSSRSRLKQDDYRDLAIRLSLGHDDYFSVPCGMCLNCRVDNGLDIRDTHPNDLTPRKGPSDFDKATFESSEEIHQQNAFINYINSIGYEFIEPNKIKKGSVLVEIADNELLDLEEKAYNYTDELLMELIKKKIGLWGETKWNS